MPDARTAQYLANLIVILGALLVLGRWLGTRRGRPVHTPTGW